MKDPEPIVPPAPPPDRPLPAATAPPKRRLTRRRLLQLVGGATVVGLAAECGRVVAGPNAHTVIPGRVYRTAQLSPGQLEAFIAEKGIRTVINLRGVGLTMPWYWNECRVTHAANVNQEDITLSAKRLPAPAEVQRLIDVLDHTEYPLVIHCQRGADRTGLAATIVRLLFTPDTLAAARRQLSPRYAHLPVGRTAVMGQFFDYYERYLAERGETHAPERLRRWVNTTYCPGPYRAELRLLTPPQFPAQRGFTFTIRATNTAIEPWRFTPGAGSGLRLCYTLTDPTGQPIYRGYAGFWARWVHPGEFLDIVCGVPPLPAGAYQLHSDLHDIEPIELLTTAFVQYGSEPLEIPIDVI
ncbi:MAG: tyrosine-protein phosphatase [Gemmataceae bacterium]|nr:tyrosine-protein phosphatase [Gemmata sp.]MDW8196395.1 tyrosine-protein phosphatase [Gemmataceae bacterium]